MSYYLELRVSKKPRPSGAAPRRPRPGHCAGIPRRAALMACAERRARASVCPLPHGSSHDRRPPAVLFRPRAELRTRHRRRDVAHRFKMLFSSALLAILGDLLLLAVGRTEILARRPSCHWRCRLPRALRRTSTQEEKEIQDTRPLSARAAFRMRISLFSRDLGFRLLEV